MKQQVLVVDDEPLQRDILQAILSDAGYEVRLAANGREALVQIGRYLPDIVLTDLKMPEVGGLQLLRELPEDLPLRPTVIVVTAHGTIGSAVAAVKEGAFDYLTKPLDKEQLLLTMRKAGERAEILKDNQRLRAQLQDRFRLEGIIGRSARMQEVVGLLRKVAATSATIMLRGESGTGKELVARAIHFSSPRSKRPFTALNCAAIPENLFESELFGHEPGAFTGASSRRKGLLEIAHGGTLLLDEIGDLPLTMQSKLLRVLQDREIRRIGGHEVLKIDVRLITATNKDLEREIEQGNFREDLYYRLNVVQIDLPPLRERLEDLPLLIDYFLQRANAEFGRSVRGCAPEALRALDEYRWPGNVRQLKAVIERAVLLCEGELLQKADLKGLLNSRSNERRVFEALPADGVDFEALEKDLIRQALERSGGVSSRAARLLRMNYKQFLYRAAKYGFKDQTGN